MKSMTGFGRGEAELSGRSVTAEVRSVNHRYLETNVRISHALSALEQKVRGQIKEKLSRGKVDVFISYANHSDDQGEVWVNEPRLLQAVEALREAGKKVSLTDDLTLSSLLSLPDLLGTERKAEDTEALWELVQKALSEALSHMVSMREEEGAALQKDFREKLSELEEQVRLCEERGPLLKEEYRNRLKERLETLLEKPSALDEGRLEMEVTLFADKACIDEELTRLRSHISQFGKLLEQKDPVGRQLDFLTQELNREANTIASKASDLAITQAALAMKNCVEKIREQVQNVE